MKTILKFSGLVLLIATLATSCIKEKHVIDHDDNTDRTLIEFTTAKDGVNSLALDFGTQVIEVDLTEVRIPTRSVVNGDVQVKLALNNAIVSQAGYDNLPAGSFVISSYDFTLSDANRKGVVKLKINPSMIVGGSYAIGLSINQVSQGEISELYKDIIIELKVKNDYEGEYHATGQRISYAGADIASGVASTFEIDDDKYLYTIDQTTVETDVADLIGGGYMFLTVNPVTNNVTVSPSTVSPTFALSNDGPSTYNPATRTFHLKYKYFNASGNLRRITEVIEAY